MVKFASQMLLGAAFVLAGCLHFRFPGAYVKIVPPTLPCPLFLVYLSGLCEVGLGALMFTRFSSLAAWGLIALLIAVFPANIYMALRPGMFPQVARFLLWARLPLQGLLIAWAYWHT